MPDARVLALALAIDVVCGEPAAALHPVVWMGRVLDLVRRGAPKQPRAQVAYGALVACAAPLGWSIFGLVAERVLPWPLQALLLKPTFAGRALLGAGRRVASALSRDDVAAARADLRALVSRPADELDASLVSAAAIESLAENTVDSWLAPLLAYTMGGLPGAYAYRAANTADAMWGYRTAEFEYLGKAAARLDDVLNWLPARLAAVLLCAVSVRPRAALQAWAHDARKTASPNAGQAMSAAAGALGVRLEKVNHYVLNAQARAPSAVDVDRAVRLIKRVMLVSAVAITVWIARRAA